MQTGLGPVLGLQTTLSPTSRGWSVEQGVALHSRCGFAAATESKRSRSLPQAAFRSSMPVLSRALPSRETKAGQSRRDQRVCARLGYRGWGKVYAVECDDGIELGICVRFEERNGCRPHSKIVVGVREG